MHFLPQGRIILIIPNSSYLCDMLKERIFNISSQDEFRRCALEVFRFQYANCDTYREYVDLLGVEAESVGRLEDIPFLPIKFFKSREVIIRGMEPEIVFRSSATTGMVQSNHFVADLSLYRRSFMEGFSRVYGVPEEYTILALLPSYLEREDSSLVFMVNELIKTSKRPDSGFFLYNYEDLYQILQRLQRGKKRTILIGVSFALLDFVEKYRMEWPELVVMETGGMKGKRKELSRKELHGEIRSAFGVEKVHSEYGMAELLSQAYSRGDGIFETPPWMRIMIRDLTDPLSYLASNRRGGVNIIDLANINSCSFIESEDMGSVSGDEKNPSFTVEGRILNSELRGCNMLTELF